ncbi:hypothetical protein SAMN05192559_102409 [Halobacillus karajensis]|uniref:Amino acid permease n=1 Tax=Halobacillus karajensis TaxID=195088 RepID=A0A024P631_9BACI|nr:hypothetical protein [Halobacillus karajensis]CDQ17797.1 hypothetical protein BN982_00035 [Halobacillus karajensis]CDQ24203.1 hypothetical protein BN983_02475 [Halobacillus karajensis]CDQ29548.1 hypothetical protein BN981_03931 [Halobacillus karajensis]SEH63671.1 hypothetical protein SAMN05192559_102409 [Halobacillus karajensis]
MLELSMIVITGLLVAFYTYFLYKKRKGMENRHGWKSMVTPAVFIIAPIAALVSYLFHLGGMFTWLFLGICFITGAFYTKYLPQTKENH